MTGGLARATIAQIALTVSDVDRSVQFYRDVLHLPFLFTAPPAMAFFECSGVRLLLGAAEDRAVRPGSSVVYFEVEDIALTYEQLSERGVRFAAPPHVVHRTPSTELWLAEFADPDGNALALMSTTAVAEST